MKEIKGNNIQFHRLRLRVRVRVCELTNPITKIVYIPYSLEIQVVLCGRIGLDGF
jgi:hypothetical protein